MTRALLNSAASDPLIDALPCGLVQLDPGDRVVLWNHRMQHWTGFTFAAVRGRLLSEIFPEITSPTALFAEIRASGQPRPVTAATTPLLLPIRLPAGHESGLTTMPQSCQLSPLAEPAGHLVITLLDTTAEAVAQQRWHSQQAELIASRDQAERAFQDLVGQQFAIDQHAIVVVTDARGLITYVNDKFCALSQYARGDLIGRNHRLINSGHHPAAFFQAMWARISQGEVWHGEICNRARDGSLFWVATTIVPLGQEDGRPAKYVAIRTDITAHKEAERILVLAKAEAEAGNRAKAAFLSTMSHEIRTPMNGVIGFSGLLLDTTLDADQRTYVEILRSSGEDLLRILNDILHYSELESAPSIVASAAFDPAALVHALAAEFAPKALERHVALTVAITPGTPSLFHADPTRVRQVLAHLVANALKFTEQGRVTLQVAPVLHGDRSHLRISVTDTGIGIPRSHHGQIFQHFKQGDSSITRLYGGAGLGLAISKRLISVMGGEIAFVSAPGEGSTFWFDLPALPSLPPREPTTLAPLALATSSP